MKGLIKKGFTDKYTGLYYEKGKTIETSDIRIKELADLGYVEAKGAPKVKPEIKEEPKAEPKAEPKKKTTTKKK